MKQSVPRNHFQSSMQFWQNRDARKAVWENSLAICLGIRTLADNDVKICWRLSLPSLASWTSLNFENTFEKYVCVSKMRLLVGDLFRIGDKNVTKLCLMQSTCFSFACKSSKEPKFFKKYLNNTTIPFYLHPSNWLTATLTRDAPFATKWLRNTLGSSKRFPLKFL